MRRVVHRHRPSARIRSRGRIQQQPIRSRPLIHAAGIELALISPKHVHMSIDRIGEERRIGGASRNGRRLSLCPCLARAVPDPRVIQERKSLESTKQDYFLGAAVVGHGGSGPGAGAYRSLYLFPGLALESPGVVEFIHFIRAAEYDYLLADRIVGRCECSTGRKWMRRMQLNTLGTGGRRSCVRRHCHDERGQGERQLWASGFNTLAYKHSVFLLANNGRESYQVS